ncbi:MAG: hypothetical protein JXR71_08860 [Bacteroidales bacterium]|nr:hypothetical protein [Bacteroidales bacterium]
MKKLLLFFFLLLLSVSLFCQPEKGKRLINISGTAEYDLQRGHNLFTIKLQPKAGWFLNQYFCLGAQTGLGYGHEKIYSSVSGETQQYWFNTNAYVLEAGPLVRFYYPAKRNAAFFHTAFLYQHVREVTKTDYKNLSNNIRTHGGSVQLGIGYAFFITPNIGIELLPAYQWTFSKATVSGDILPVSGTVSGKSVSKKLVVTLGLQFYLGSKSKKSN